MNLFNKLNEHNKELNKTLICGESITTHAKLKYINESLVLSYTVTACTNIIEPLMLSKQYKHNKLGVYHVYTKTNSLRLECTKIDIASSNINTTELVNAIKAEYLVALNTLKQSNNNGHLIESISTFKNDNALNLKNTDELINELSESINNQYHYIQAKAKAEVDPELIVEAVYNPTRDDRIFKIRLY